MIRTGFDLNIDLTFFKLNTDETKVALQMKSAPRAVFSEPMPDRQSKIH